MKFTHQMTPIKQAKRRFTRAVGRRRNFMDDWMREFGHGCHYCGQCMVRTTWADCKEDRVEWGRYDHAATIDHVVPLTRGGDAMSKDNWQVICRLCNVAKDDLTHYEFLHLLDGNGVTEGVGHEYA